MRQLLGAFQFLTIIPVPSRFGLKEGDMERSIPCFPLAGLLIGCILAIADLGLSQLFPRHLADAIIVALLAGLTGGLHLDGVADMCDGLAARGDRERFLSIMKDPRVGAAGVIGLVLLLMLKYSALLAIPLAMKRPALLFFPTVARFCQVLMIQGSRSPVGNGLGAAFINGTQPWHIWAALAFTLPIAWLGLGVAGLAAMTVASAWVLFVKLWMTRRLGGITGDIIGFASETSEIIALLSIIATTVIITRLP